MIPPAHLVLSPIVDLTAWKSLFSNDTILPGADNNDHHFFLGHNWFGDEWPSLGLTEEEFLAEYSKTLDKLADTHTR